TYAIGGRSGLCGGPVDSDGDGVTDDMDKCPETPNGVSVDAKGCALDTDGDGVADYKDKCPGTPAGAAVDANGCQMDSDGDGVYDAQDKCPNTPKGAKVDSDGCMEKLVLRNVQFENNSAQLTAEAQNVLGPIAEVLKGRPDIKALAVVGHTDSKGSEAYNQRLSQARAQSVAEFFKSAGISTPVSADGMGESTPVADNATAAGRAQNRRVELDIKK
ncbi:MAG: OmpA family protein, partial [Candidatus Sedimenticola sp. 4PFRAG1]